MVYFLKERIVDIGMLCDLILHHSKELDWITFLYNSSLIIFGRLLNKDQYSEIIGSRTILSLCFGALNTIFP